jgi:hypothetical protein
MSIESPNYYNFHDRALFHELEKIPYELLTEEQRRFFHRMYHMEEYASGLDGDFEDIE